MRAIDIELIDGRVFRYDVTPGRANFVQVDWGGESCIDETAVWSAVCPDLLELDEIGAADNLRGRVVRAFFVLMRFWKP